MGVYEVIFSGQMVAGADPLQVRQAVQRLFNASEQMLDQLFSGRKVVVKRGVDLALRKSTGRPLFVPVPWLRWWAIQLLSLLPNRRWQLHQAATRRAALQRQAGACHRLKLHRVMNTWPRSAMFRLRTSGWQLQVKTFCRRPGKWQLQILTSLPSAWLRQAVIWSSFRVPSR